ncbi:hypothetical protein ACHAXN_003600 [Cyclotella atomus]
MINALLLFLLMRSFAVSGFKCPTAALRLQPTASAMRLHLAASNDETKFNDEIDEPLLRINFSYQETTDDDALESIQQYTRSFPFAAVLPVQPLTYLPCRLPDGETALKVTFLRKKTEEKDAKDGGMIFQWKAIERTKISLVASRISKGQTVPKIFSEKQIVLAFIKGLDEERGREMLKKANLHVASIFHQWMSV